MVVDGVQSYCANAENWRTDSFLKLVENVSTVGGGSVFILSLSLSLLPLNKCGDKS
jgi:hypothetical protein